MRSGGCCPSLPFFVCSGLRGIDVNMADQTDCFMTLAAVAAVATGTTTITGIANQRVKECNRIAAMVAELGKCGVRCWELPDGIGIEGCGGKPLVAPPAGTAGASAPPWVVQTTGEPIIHCYDDHRIAMSMGVLACALTQLRQAGPTPSASDATGGAGGAPLTSLVLDDAACVEKTFPSVWDCYEAYYGATVTEAAAELGHLTAAAKPATTQVGATGGSAASSSAPAAAAVKASGSVVASAPAAVTASSPSDVAGAGLSRACTTAPSLPTLLPAGDAVRAAVAAGPGDGATTSTPLATRLDCIVFVGMRGAGKSTLAAVASGVVEELVAAARRLRGPIVASDGGASAGVELIDLDRLLETRYTAERNTGAAAEHGRRYTVTDLIAAEGWPAFRQRERDLLYEHLAASPAPSAAGAGMHWRVLACGGGVVETPACRALLASHAAAGGLVVEIRRPVEDIARDLGVPVGETTATAAAADTGRPSYAGGASLSEVYGRRRAAYSACASHVFAVAAGDSDWASATDGGVTADFRVWLTRLMAPRLGLAMGPIATSHTAAEGAAAASSPEDIAATGLRDSDAAGGDAAPWQTDGSHFLCLTLPDLRQLVQDASGTAAALDSTAATFSDTARAVGRRLHAMAAAEGASGIELRVDLLHAVKSCFGADACGGPVPAEGAACRGNWWAVECALAETMALLRRAMRVGHRLAITEDVGTPADGAPRGLVVDDAAVHMPVLWTVRSDTEGGTFHGVPPCSCSACSAAGAADESAAAAYVWLTAMGVRLGADAVDVELGRCRSGGSTKIDAEPSQKLARPHGLPSASLLPLLRYSAASGVCIIASAHWPGLVCAPGPDALAQAAARSLLVCAQAAFVAGGGAAIDTGLAALDVTPTAGTDGVVAIVDGAVRDALAHARPAVALHTAAGLQSPGCGYVIVPTVVKLIGSAAAPHPDVVADYPSIDGAWNSISGSWLASVHNAVGPVVAAFMSALTPASPQQGPALLALLMGGHPAQSRSRALNQHLTPVTHPALPTAAAPGQLTASDIGRLRTCAGKVAPRSYALFGHPIGASPSPSMHNSAFAAAHLPHTYGLFDTEVATDAAAALLGERPAAASAAGGAVTAAACMAGGSVTMPLKATLLHALRERAAVATTAAAIVAGATGTAAQRSVTLQESADVQVLGVANTLRITVCPSGSGKRVEAFNTDWLGIARPLRARLQHSRASSSAGRACDAVLIVGAGGTAQAAAYAVQRLGLLPVAFNPRTPEKARYVTAFGGVAVTPDARASGDACLSPAALEAAGVPPSAVAGIISTLPPTAGWTAPEWVYTATGPAGAALPPLIVFDVAYRPRRTPLLAQALAANERAAAAQAACITPASTAGAAAAAAVAVPRRVMVIEGVEMLVEQGALQNAVWTGKGNPAACPIISTVPLAAAAALGTDIVLTGTPFSALAVAAYRRLEEAAPPPPPAVA